MQSGSTGTERNPGLLWNRTGNKMKIYLIRHGMTAGNREKRYVGCHTDEDLCEEGIAQIQNNEYPRVDRLYVSPLKRCITTAGLIYPHMPVISNVKLQEMDFGDFEYKNYHELNGNAAYQAWIDSGGKTAFPNGESREQFCRRCAEGFRECLADCKDTDRVAFVVHGGTIMAIMEQYGEPKGEYYTWQIANGAYLSLEVMKSL